MSEEAVSSDAARATARVRGLIEDQDDVRRVVALERVESPGGWRWLYLIETPFMTFPKFAVGTTDADNEDVQILTTCGSIWAAQESFNTALECGGVLPPES
jgi:hypothetical protein